MHLWHYRARPIRVIDGDTIEAVIDLGFGTTRRERIRVLDVDTPELRSSDPIERIRGQEAKAYTEAWLASDEEWPLNIHTSKGDSFGRWLAEITRQDGRSLGQDLKNLF
jgi:micrococcal nuclease